MKQRNFHDFLTHRKKENGSRLLFQKKDGWSWKQITWPDLMDEVESVACFLLNSGFTPGKEIVVFCPNTLKCLFFELAVFMIGGTSLPAASVGEAKKILENSREIRFLLRAESGRELDSDPSLEKNVERIFAISDEKLPVEGKTVNYANAVKFGFLSRKKLKDKLAAVGSAVKEESPAVIFGGGNGSGETARFSQKEILDILSRSEEAMGDVAAEDQMFSYLPFCDSFSKFANMMSLQTGTRGATAASIEDFLSDILEIMPTTIFLRKGEIENVARRIRNANGQSSSLKNGLGGRAKLIFTDAAPDEETTGALAGEGVSTVELESLRVAP